MIGRAAFLEGLSLAVAASASVSAPPPSDWDMCDQSGALPYDRPLALTMRVLDGPDFDLRIGAMARDELRYRIDRFLTATSATPSPSPSPR